MTETNDLVSQINKDLDFINYISHLTDKNIPSVVNSRTNLIVKYKIEGLQAALLNHFENTCLSLAAEDGKSIQSDDNELIQNLIDELEFIQTPDDQVTNIIKTVNSQEKKFQIKFA